VARVELDVVLTKDNQKDDWSRRPLTPQQEAYAAADVAHLIALSERLSAQLEAAGRLGWLREECAAVAALEPAAKRRDPDAYLSVKGAKRLAPRALAVLRELVAWRERRAQTLDLPAFKVLGNEVLLRLAELPPGTTDLALRLPPRLQRQAGELLTAIARAHALAPAELPVVPRSARPILPDDVVRRITRMKSWRTQKAAELKLDVAVVLPQRLIDKLADAAPRDLSGLGAIEGLRRWRIESFGRELLAAL
jgi:ribonuclease D